MSIYIAGFLGLLFWPLCSLLLIAPGIFFIVNNLIYAKQITFNKLPGILDFPGLHLYTPI